MEQRQFHHHRSVAGRNHHLARVRRDERKRGGITFSITNNSGFNYSQTVPADGAHTSITIPANTIPNNAYYSGGLQFTNNDTGSPTSFQEQDNFTIAVGTPPDVSNYTVQKEENFGQASSAAPTLDPSSPFEFYAQVNTNGGPSVLLSTSTVAAPAGSPNFFTSGTNGLSYQQRFITKSSFDAAYPSGNYNLALNTSTPNAYTAVIALGTDNYPPVPQIIGLTNATWSGGAVVVTDITQPVTIIWNTFINSLGSIDFGVNNANFSEGGLAADGTHNSYTIPAGALSNNQSYEAYLQFENNVSGASSTIAGAFGNAIYSTQDQFIIQTGTVSSSSSASNIPLIYKENVQVQTSNSAPVNASPNTPLVNNDTAPYGLLAQNATGGSVTGPGAGSPYALGFKGDTDGDKYRYSTGSLAALIGAGGLNTLYPDGTYTFKDTQGNTLASLSLTGDVYPNVPQVLLVNGLTPTWNGQGQLVLDPTIDNVISWTAFTTTNPSYNALTGGHISAQFSNSNSNDSVDIELESGAIKSKGDISAPFTSLRIPANSMTNGNTYNGNIEYFLASSGNFTDGVATSAAGYITDNTFTAVATTPTPLVLSYVQKIHVVQQTSSSAPIDVSLGTTSPSGNVGPYNFGVQSAASGGATGPGGPYTLTFDSGDQAYEYNSAAFASEAASNAADANGAYTLPDSSSVNLTGDEYPAAAQITAVNGAAPVWNGSGQLLLDPTIQNTLTWTTFPTTFGTFAAAGYQDMHIEGNQDNVAIEQKALGVTGGTPFTSYTIPANTLTVGNTYYSSVTYAVFPSIVHPSANVYDFAAYATENAFTIAPQTSTSQSNSVTKVVNYQQTSTSVPTQVATPYSFSAFGTATGSVGGVATATVPGPYALTSGAGGFDYSGASYANLANLNTAYPDGAYTLADGTPVSLTGDAYPTAPQITLVNGVAPVWNGNGQLVLNPGITNIITWTAYAGSFANGEEAVSFNTSSPNFTLPSAAFGAGSGSSPASAYNTMIIPAGSISAGSVYAGTIQYYADSTVTRLASGNYDTARYETQMSFAVLASSENSAEKAHVLQQTSNSAPVDYVGLADMPGPYNFHSFGGTDGSTTGPASSYPLTFSASDNTYEFFSAGYTTLAGLNTAYPDGNYTLGNGVQVALTGDIFPNIVQLTAVNGAPPTFDSSGDLTLNPAIANTLTWTPFTASNGSFNYSTGGIEHIEISGNQDSVDINDQGAGPEGTPAFNTLTIPANTLTAGNTYTSSFIYQLASAGTFGTSPSIAVYLTDTYLTIFATGTNLQGLNNINSISVPNQVVGNAPVTLDVTTNSGLNVSYSVTGPATLTTVGAGVSTLTVTGPGIVTLTTSIPGDSIFAPVSLTSNFNVSAAPPVQQINGVTILHSFGDGSVTNDGLQPGAGLIQGSDGYFYGMSQFGGSANQGAVFKISPQGQLYILHSFSDGSVSHDGAQPFDSLVQGPDGNFYGTTTLGGLANTGAAFKITPGGQLTILHDFGGDGVTNDGTSPQSGLTLGSDGNYYGVSFAGGSAGLGAAYKMTPAGGVTILHSFGDNSVTNDGVTPIFNLVLGVDGNFYGTAPGGVGQSTSGCVFKMTPVGTVTPLHSFGDGTVAHDGIKPFGALIQATDGSFYGTTELGGTASSGTAYKVSPAGQVTILHSFGDGSVHNDGTTPADKFLLGTDGIFYGTTKSGGSAGQGVVYQITPQGQVIVLHSFGDGSVVNDGNQDNNANSLVEASDGTFYGATLGGGSAGQGTVFKLALGIQQLTSSATAAGTATLPFTYQVTTSTPTTNFVATNLPAGLSINQATGLITGTPTTPGTSTTTFTLTGASGSNTAQVVFTIIPLPVPGVTSILYAFGSVGNTFTYTPTATNAPTSYSANGLAGTGLAINSTNGVISGQPLAAGTYPVAITATNATGPGTASNLTIRIFATAPTLGEEYVVLHRFNDGSVTNTGINIGGGPTAVDAQNPFSIFQAFDGTYYGTSSAGGAYGDGAIFNMTDQGTTSIVANFSTSGAATPVPVVPQNLLQGADGNFYVATEFGGDNTSSGNFAMANAATGAHAILHNFGDGSVTNDGLNPQGQPVQGKDGYFYGVTLNGGTAGKGTVYKINTLGVETVLHSFGDNSVQSDGASPVSTLIQASDGNFYGTTPAGGAYNDGTIYEITPQGHVTILYSFAQRHE